MVMANALQAAKVTPYQEKTVYICEDKSPVLLGGTRLAVFNLIASCWLVFLENSTLSGVQSWFHC